MTAQALLDAQPDPKSPLSTSSLLREQHYGLGEGKRYDVTRDPALSLTEHFARGEYPWLRSRTERFPEGESLEDVARRAEEAIEEIVLPYVWNAAEGETEGVHVAVVSHGTFIREAIAALLRKTGSAERANPQDYRGLQNTGCTKVTININQKVIGCILWLAHVLTVCLSEQSRRRRRISLRCSCDRTQLLRTSGRPGI